VSCFVLCILFISTLYNIYIIIKVIGIERFINLFTYKKNIKGDI